MPGIAKTIVPAVRQSLQKRGVMGTVWRCLLGPLYLVRTYTRVHRNYRRALPPDAFDLAHGVETTSRVHMTDLQIDSPNWIHAGGYWPTPTDLIQEVLSELKIRYEDFTFIDFGSGKGRVMLMASEFPFRRIMGVEFSRELHEIAERNVARYRSATRKCKVITPVCADFTQFPIPPDPLIAFLYNPADEQIMTVLVDNILRSLRAHPRDMWFIYVTPTYGVFDRNPAFRKIKSADKYAVYTTTS